MRKRKKKEGRKKEEDGSESNHEVVKRREYFCWLFLKRPAWWKRDKGQRMSMLCMYVHI